MKMAAIALVALLCCLQASARDPFRLQSDDVVVFLGGTNLLHQQQAGYLEVLMTQAFPEAKAKFRDFTWEADTVFRQGTVIERWRKDGWKTKGFGDLTQQLKSTSATVIVAQFGQMEALHGVDPDVFERGYEELLKQF